MNFSKLTHYLDSLESKYEVHGLDCKVMRGHEVLYRHTAGHSDYAMTRPVSENDLYDLYSCTKVITMAGVMQSKRLSRSRAVCCRSSLRTQNRR